MNSQTIRILPKMQIGASDFVQSVYQAVDTGSAEVGVIQLWVETGLVDVDFTIQEAIVNEEDEYSDSTQNSVLTVLKSDGVLLKKILLPRRFIRLKISAPSTVTNVRGELILLGGGVLKDAVYSKSSSSGKCGC